MKNTNGNGRPKRLKKRYQSVESDDEMSVPEDDDGDDCLISSICKNNKAQETGGNINEENVAEVEKKPKNNHDKYKSDAVNSQVVESEDKADVHFVDEKTEEWVFIF